MPNNAVAEKLTPFTTIKSFMMLAVTNKSVSCQVHPMKFSLKAEHHAFFSFAIIQFNTSLASLRSGSFK